MDPLSLLRRLAVPAPRPFTNPIKYYGVFANRSKLRPGLPKPAPLTRPDRSSPHAHPSPGKMGIQATTKGSRPLLATRPRGPFRGCPSRGPKPPRPAVAGPPAADRPRRLSWALLLHIDAGLLGGLLDRRATASHLPATCGCSRQLAAGRPDQLDDKTGHRHVPQGLGEVPRSRLRLRRGRRGGWPGRPRSRRLEPRKWPPPETRRRAR